MNLREKIKQEIDSLSDEEVQKLEKLIVSLKTKKRTDGLPTFDLGGKFDKMNLRKEAYE